MKRLYLLTFICIFSIVLVSIGTAVADSTQYYSLTSALLAQQTPVETEAPVLRSPSKAFLFSAIIPGTGEIYTGAKRGYFHIAAEIGFFTGYFLTHRKAEQSRDDYVQQVKDHVKFDNPTIAAKNQFEKWNLEDFEHATMYDNWHNVYTEDAGEPVPRVGPFYWDDRENVKDEDRQINPDSQKRQVAWDLRKDSNSTFKVAKTFLGLVIFNHIVSAIDARIAAKMYNKRHAGETATFSFKTVILPNSAPLTISSGHLPFTFESQFEFHRRF